jgi:K+-sensing histidine kinase KdpD
MPILNFKETEDPSKLVIITVLLLVSVILEIYFQLILNTDIIFSHFFYIPIILACLWWKKRGLILTVFLSSLLILFPFFTSTNIFIHNQVDNILRAFLLIVICNVVVILSERISKTEYNLKERVKELNCLYEIITTINDPNKSVEEILTRSLEKIRCAFQVPTLVCVKITFDGKEYKTSNYKRSQWKLSKGILIKQRELTIDIHYIEEKPFLKEEENLLEEILKQLKAIFDLKLSWIK